MDSTHNHHMHEHHPRSEDMGSSEQPAEQIDSTAPGGHNAPTAEIPIDEAAATSTHTEHADHTGHTMTSEHGSLEGHAAPTELDEQPAHGSHHAPSSHAGHEEHAIKAKSAGHESHDAHTDHTGHEQMFKRKFWVSLILSIPVLLFSTQVQELLGFSLPAFPGDFLVTPIFSIIIFLYGGLPFLKMAVPELKNRQPGMMTLISLAIGVALIYSLASYLIPDSMPFFWELVTLIDIMLLGHWIEMRSVRQASGALQELAKLMPDTADRVLPDGRIETVPVSSLAETDLVLIRPGANVPADGEVQEGESDVNEAMITGESRPVKKQVGDRVIAGTINGDGSLRVKVTATGDKTALAGIMRLVEQAQQSKSNTQILADKAAGWLFYIALGVAAITAIAWIIAVGFNVEVIARVATVLVIACPHALGLAVPLVVAITTSMGARNGILVRDRLALEKARLIDTIIFDKTGTLTEGKFGVVGIRTIPPWTEDNALALAAAVEGDSEHTIAMGIRKTAEQRKLTLPVVSNFEAIKGKGARANQEGMTVHVGGPRLLEMLKMELPETLDHFEKEASLKGQSVVHLIRDGKAVASFALADVIRAESAQAIDKLHKLGLKVAMLTGDSQEVAKSVADELGIDTYYAEVLPENKDLQVAELQKQGHKVAMVGDGVNDAPALTRADVGIAIGSGTDVAIESAGIILVKSSPLDVVKIFDLSRASYRKMVENLVWAAGYNVVALPLAAGVLAPVGIILSPAVGALLMSVSTVIVALNAQLLRRMKF